MITKVDALQSLKPNAEWTLSGDKLEWLDSEQTEPTTAEIEAEVAKLTYQAGIKSYQTARTYPDIKEQLDKIFHDGVDAWKVQIQAVKDANPKVALVQADEDTYVAAQVATNLFNKQKAAYIVAVARLAQYVLSEGRAEVKAMMPTQQGKQVYDESAKNWVDELAEQVTVTAIDPLVATVEVSNNSSSTANETTATVTNPLIVTDVAERAAAQTVVDNTPQPVIDSV